MGKTYLFNFKDISGDTTDIKRDKFLISSSLKSSIKRVDISKMEIF